MKRLIFIFLLFASFGSIAQTIGIKVATPIIKNNPADNTSTGYADLLTGGYHIGGTYHSRDSLTTSFNSVLKVGMLFYVTGVDSTYRWSGSAWMPLALGGTTLYTGDGTITGSGIVRTVNIGNNLLFFKDPTSHVVVRIDATTGGGPDIVLQAWNSSNVGGSLRLDATNTLLGFNSPSWGQSFIQQNMAGMIIHDPINNVGLITDASVDTSVITDYPRAYVTNEWVTRRLGGSGITTNLLTVDNSGTGDVSGFTFNGSVPKKISYNSIGAQAALGFTPSPILTFTGGLQKTGTTVKLGGLIPSGVSLDLPSHFDAGDGSSTFYIGDNRGSVSYFQQNIDPIYRRTSITTSSDGSDSNDPAQFSSNLVIGNNGSTPDGSRQLYGSELSYYDNLGNIQQIHLGESPIGSGFSSVKNFYFRDDINQIGPTDYADYSANFVALSLITKVYADSHYALSGGGSPFTSIFGRTTPALIATSGDYNTSQVTENTNLYYTNARAITAPLTGYTSGAGTVLATDNILQAFQKVNGNVAANTSTISGLSSVYQPIGTYLIPTGSYADPTWITSLAYSKITGVPAFLTSYTETDPLVPSYAKGLTAFSVIKSSTDLLYGTISQQNTNTSNIATNTTNIATNTTAITGKLAASNFVFDEVPSGTINGTNVTFTLAFTPATGSVRLYKNGQRLKLTTDYTISGGTITYVVPPVLIPYPDLLAAEYIK
jgi:hypothetical protein